MPKEKKLSSLSSDKGGCGIECVDESSSLSSSTENNSSSSSNSNNSSSNCPGGKGC